MVPAPLWHSPDNFRFWFLRDLFFPDSRNPRGAQKHLSRTRYWGINIGHELVGRETLVQQLVGRNLNFSKAFLCAPQLLLELLRCPGERRQSSCTCKRYYFLWPCSSIFYLALGYRHHFYLRVCTALGAPEDRVFSYPCARCLHKSRSDLRNLE